MSQPTIQEILKASMAAIDEACPEHKTGYYQRGIAMSHQALRKALAAGDAAEAERAMDYIGYATEKLAEHQASLRPAEKEKGKRKVK